MRYAKHYSTQETPQSEPIPGTSQVEDSAGGYAWAVDDWMRLHRFLILGCEDGSYYASEHKLTVENAEAVRRCIAEDGPRTVRQIVEISDAGRAPKNDPALFALAMCASMGDDKTRAAAFAALPKVARIGTHLFNFVAAVEGFRGWGKSLRRAVANWYNAKDADDLAYQMCKYRERGGWANRDLLRLAHPKPSTPAHEALYQWAVSKPFSGLPPDLVLDFMSIQEAENIRQVVDILKKNTSLSWEMVPTQFLGESKVWGELLPRLPMTALLRNIGRMSANGLLKPLSEASATAAKRIVDVEAIKKARVHPIAVLSALNTYAAGHGVRGSLTWEPVSQVIDALDEAFYLSFGNVEPTGKRLLLALDVSPSMNVGQIAGVPGLSPRVASAAMALVTARTEPNWHMVAFAGEMVPMEISPRERLDDVLRKIGNIDWDSTNCALPMLWAKDKPIDVDCFTIYTDSETWSGDIHPHQALQNYRQAHGIPARLVVCGMVSNGFSIADPDDAGELDLVGFDTATPQLISDFAAGKV